MEIYSVFEVTNYKTKKIYDEAIEGSGQDAIGYLRKEYPKFSKFVLKGFEIEDKNIRVNLKTQNRC